MKNLIISLLVILTLVSYPNGIKTENNNTAFTIENSYDHLPIKASDADAVAICKFDSIGESTNQNPTTKEYTMINTYATLKVEKVLKGKLDSKEIEVVMGGGELRLDKYYNGLSKEEKKRFDLRHKYSDDEKQSLFVKSYSHNTVNVFDKNKYYLSYLIYNKDYNRYRLVTYKENLREVKIAEKILVKNPENGKYEELNLK